MRPHQFQNLFAERAVTYRPGHLRCHAQSLCIRRIDVEIAFQNRLLRLALSG